MVICQPSPVHAAQAMGAPWVRWVSAEGLERIPHPGGITLICLSRKPWQFLNMPARCGQEAQETRKRRKVRKSESWKLSGNTCSEGGKRSRMLFCCTSYTNTHFLYAKQVVCALKTSETSHTTISFCLHSGSGPTSPTLMHVTYVGFLGVFPTLLASEM